MARQDVAYSNRSPSRCAAQCKIKKPFIDQVLAAIGDIHGLLIKTVCADLNLSRRAVYRVLALFPTWQRRFVSMIVQFWQQQVFPLLGPSIYKCQLLSRDAAS